MGPRNEFLRWKVILSTLTDAQKIKPMILTHLQLIFQKSLEDGIIPQDWRDAHVSPMFIKGAKGDPGKYRTVSLTSIVCKLLVNHLRPGHKQLNWTFTARICKEPIMSNKPTGIYGNTNGNPGPR